MVIMCPFTKFSICMKIVIFKNFKKTLISNSIDNSSHRFFVQFISPSLLTEELSKVNEAHNKFEELQVRIRPSANEVGD